MRWAVFLIFAVIGIVFDAGFGDVFRVEGLWNIRPSLCAVLVVFVALSAPRTLALWACFVLGLLVDLSSQHTAGGNRIVYLVGPHTLGFLAAGWMVVRGRTMVFRRRPLTIGVMTLGCVLVAQAIVLTVMVLRSGGWYPGGVIHWTDTTLGVEVLRRVLIAVYSALFAIPAGWLLVRTIPLWGFQAVSHRSPMMR